MVIFYIWLLFYGVNLWRGTFKGLDDGKEDYIISDHLWPLIGKETTEAMALIPADFVRSLGNPVEDQANMTAEGWSFWFMSIAPIVLKGRFKKVEYYNHFEKLVRIMKTCTQFSLHTLKSTNWKKVLKTGSKNTRSEFSCIMA